MVMATSRGDLDDIFSHIWPVAHAELITPLYQMEYFGYNNN